MLIFRGRLHLDLSKLTYRATQHLDSYILLTSKQKFPRLVGRYCSYLLPTLPLSTFNLKSTEYRNQGAVSPCTLDQVVDDHAGEVRHAAFSPDGNWLATCGCDAQVRRET